MPYDLNELGFMNKYDNIKFLVDVELAPLLEILLKLSTISNNFSSTANRIANIDITETHEIKEFLELTFDSRKLAKKVQEVIEFRTEVVVEAAKCCYYESKPAKQKDEDHNKYMDTILAAGNKFVNVNKGTQNSNDKKNGKSSDENVKDKKEKPQKQEEKTKDIAPEGEGIKDNTDNSSKEKEKGKEKNSSDKK